MILSIIKTIFISTVSLLLTFLIVRNPAITVEASIEGLTLWWNKVFPSLLPFFILSELMMAFGIVKFIGVIFEPIMRPVFKVPGIGGFVLVMGMISGFPNGARMTANLFKSGLLTKVEAIRLSTFTNFSNPLFIFAVVAYSFFNSPKLGLIFAGSHYLGNLLVGLLMRFYHRKDKEQLAVEASEKTNGRLISRAFYKMHETRISQKRPLGKILGDAVQSSVSTLLMVGGFIILFSVISRLLEHIQLLALGSAMIVPIFKLLHFSPSLAHPFLTGWFEMTIGAKNVSATHSVLIDRVMLTSFLLGFSGFSIQAQVVSLLSDVKLKTAPFLYSRFLHGFFAAVLSGVACVLFPLAAQVPAFKTNAVPVHTVFFLESSSKHLYPELFFFITIIILIFYIYWTIFRQVKRTPR